MDYESARRSRLASSPYGVDDSPFSASATKDSQKLRLSRLKVELDQALGAGLITEQEYISARDQDRASWIQHALFDAVPSAFGVDTSGQRQFSGGIIENLADVLSVPNYLTAAYSEAWLDASKRGTIPTVFDSKSMSAFADSWINRRSYIDFNERHQLYGDNPRLNFAMGFLQDVALDPTTYLTLGSSVGMRLAPDAVAALPKAGKIAAVDGGSLTTTRFGSRIYQLAARQLMPELRREFAEQASARGLSSVDELFDVPAATQFHQRILNHMVSNFDQLYAESLRLQTQGTLRKMGVGVFSAGQGGQALMARAAKKLGQPLHTVDDLFQETASVLGRERGVYSIDRAQAILGKGAKVAGVGLPAFATKPFAKLFDTFDRGWDAPPEVVAQARLFQSDLTLSMIEHSERASRRLGAYTQDFRKEVGRALLAREQGELGRATLAGVAEYSHEAEDIISFMQEEMADILKNERAAGYGTGMVKDYITRIYGHLPQAKSYALEAAYKNGEESWESPNRFTQARLIASISDEAFAEGRLLEDVQEIILRRRRVSEEMIRRTKFEQYIVETQGIPALLLQKVSDGADSGLLRGFFRRAAHGVHEILSVDQVWKSRSGNLSKLGFRDGDSPFNRRVLAYHQRGFDWKSSDAGQAEADDLGLSDEARWFSWTDDSGSVDIQGIKVNTSSRQPLPEDFRWRAPGKEGISYHLGGRYAGEARDMKVSVQDAMRALEDPAHFVWDDVFESDSSKLTIEPNRVFGFLSGLHRYTKKYLDAQLTALYPDLDARVYRAIRAQGEKRIKRARHLKFKSGESVTISSMSGRFADRVEDIVESSQAAKGMVEDAVSKARIESGKTVQAGVDWDKLNDDFIKSMDRFIAEASSNVELKKLEPQLPESFIQLAERTRAAIGDVRDSSPMTNSQWREITRLATSVGFTLPTLKEYARRIFGGELKNARQADLIIDSLSFITSPQELERLLSSAVLPGSTPTHVTKKLAFLSDFFGSSSPVKRTVRMVRKVKGNIVPEVFDQKLGIPASADLPPSGSAAAWRHPDYVDDAETTIRDLPEDAEDGDFDFLDPVADDSGIKIEEMDSNRPGSLGSTSVVDPVSAKAHKSSVRSAQKQVKFAEKKAKRAELAEKTAGRWWASAALRLEELTKKSNGLKDELDHITRVGAPAAKIRLQLSRLREFRGFLKRVMTGSAKQETLQNYLLDLPEVAKTFAEVTFREINSSDSIKRTGGLNAASRYAGVMEDAAIKRYAQIQKIVESSPGDALAMLAKESESLSEVIVSAKKIRRSIRLLSAKRKDLKAARQHINNVRELLPKINNSLIRMDFWNDSDYNMHLQKVTSALFGHLKNSWEGFFPVGLPGRLDMMTGPELGSYRRELQKRLASAVDTEIGDSRDFGKTSELYAKRQQKSAEAASGLDAANAGLRSATAAPVDRLHPEIGWIADVDVVDRPSLSQRYVEARKVWDQLRPLDGNPKTPQQRAAASRYHELRLQMAVASRDGIQIGQAELDEFTGGVRPSNRLIDVDVYLPEGVAKVLDDVLQRDEGIWAARWLSQWDKLMNYWKANVLLPWAGTVARNAAGNFGINLLTHGISIFEPERAHNYLQVMSYIFGNWTDWGKGNSDKLARLGQTKLVAANGREISIADYVHQIQRAGQLHGYITADILSQPTVTSRVGAAASGAAAGGLAGFTAGAMAGEEGGDYGAILGAAAGAFIGGRVPKSPKSPRAAAGWLGGIPAVAADRVTGLIQSNWKPFLRAGEMAAETPFRVMMHLNEFMATGSMHNANQKTYRHMGDYLALSGTERRVMRRIMNFYGWSKVAIKNSFHHILENPGRIGNTLQFFEQQNEFGGDPLDSPDWYIDRLKLLSEVKSDDGEQKVDILTGFGLPIEDAASMAAAVFPSSDPRIDDLAELRAGILTRTPFGATSVVEGLFNVDSLTGRPIYGEGSILDRGTEWEAAPGWMKWLVGYRPSTANNESVVDPHLSWAMGETPWSRFFSVARQVYNLSPEGKRELDYYSLARTLLGANIYSVSKDKARYYRDEGRIKVMQNTLAVIGGLRETTVFNDINRDDLDLRTGRFRLRRSSEYRRGQ